LYSLDKSYFRLAILISDDLRPELIRLSRGYSDPAGREQSFASISRTLTHQAREHYGDLRIERIQISSPGLFEVAAIADIAGLLVNLFSLLRGRLGAHDRVKMEGIAAIRKIAIESIEATAQSPEVVQEIVNLTANAIVGIAREDRVTEMRVRNHRANLE